MRPDFSRVVTERPRTKGAKYRQVRRGKDRYTWRAEDDEHVGGVKAQGMRRPYRDDLKTVAKSFTDLLGPLYKFLQSRVGKPWRKVHSEICAGLKGRSTQQQHILDHLKRMVDTDLMFVDGELRNANGTKYRVYGDRNFYVDPRDGILKVVKDKYRSSWRTHKRRLEEEAEKLEVKTKEGQVFRKLDGVWYECWVEEEQSYIYMGDKPNKQITQNVEHKRQLGTDELRKRGLANESPIP